jgi:hypothetical protein
MGAASLLQNMDARRKSAATISSCNRRKREREAGDTSGSADRCGKVRRDRRRSHGEIQCGAHAGKRRKGLRRRDLPLFRATVALGQDSARERPVRTPFPICTIRGAKVLEKLGEQNESRRGRIERRSSATTRLINCRTSNRFEKRSPAYSAKCCRILCVVSTRATKLSPGE